MLGIGANLIKSAYRRGLAYVRDGLKLYMPYRGANHSEVKFVGTGSATFTSGNSEYFHIADNNNESFGDGDDDSPFTFMAWIKTDDATDFPIISKGQYNTGSAHGEYRFILGGDDKLFMYIYDDDANAYEVGYYNTAMTTYEGKWVHLAATYDGRGGSAARAGIQIYIDGVAVTMTTTGGGTYDSMVNGSGNFHIGRDETENKYADGQMKNVAMWTRELTATEIQNVMYKTYDELSGRLTSNLLHWWSLENEVDDSTGNTTLINNNTVTFSTTVYGGSTPVKPRAIDNAPTVQADGIGIGSASFTASNDDYVDCGDAVSGISDYPFSVTGWFKGETKSGDGHLFTINDVSANNVKYGVLLRQSLNEGEVRIFAQNTTTQSNTYGSANQFNDDDWHHFAAVFENATSHKLYVDGVYGVANTTSVTFNSATDSFVIGIDKDSDGLGKEFQGEMAQVGLWSKAMTQAQILSVMEKTYDEFNADDKTSLVSYWALDETLDGGSVVEDKVNSSLGSELFDAAASVFTSGTYSWVKYGNNTISNDSNALKMTHVDDARLAYLYLRDANDLSSNLTVGQVYKLTFDIKVSANSVTAKVYTGNTDPEIHGINDTSFTSKTLYFTASHATDDYILITTASGGMSCWIDNLSLKPVNGNQGGLV